MTPSCSQRHSTLPMALAIGSVLLWLTALPLQAAETVTTLASEATTTATTTPVTTPAADALWYKLETIFGDIDVGDFVVGPGRIEVSAAPGETVTVEVSVTNRISNDRAFALEVEDVEGSNDGSAAVRLLGERTGPYSIKDFISFPETELTLDLGQRARIPVTITIPPDADPGGFYGSVLVSTIRNSQVGDDSQAAPRSPIIARVGTLIFLTIEGDIVRSGETKSLDIIADSSWFTAGPIDLGIVYENTGSVHLNPYGELSVVNMFGEEVGFVELEPWFVLPRSLRVREVTWDREFLLGRYTATAQVNRGYDDVVDTVSVSFWVVPWRFLIGGFAILFISIFSIRTFFRTFEFKRRDA